MQFKHGLQLNKETALEIWYEKIDSVDRTINGLQDLNSANIWALDFWHGVRQRLVRQINLIKNDYKFKE